MTERSQEDRQQNVEGLDMATGRLTSDASDAPIDTKQAVVGSCLQLGGWALAQKARGLKREYCMCVSLLAALKAWDGPRFVRPSACIVLLAIFESS